MHLDYFIKYSKVAKLRMMLKVKKLSISFFSEYYRIRIYLPSPLNLNLHLKTQFHETGFYRRLNLFEMLLKGRLHFAFTKS